MKRPPVKVVLPIFVVVLVIAVLAATGHLIPEAPSDGSLLKIIIYTDFECGACGRFNSEIEPELRIRYEATGKAQVEIRLLGAMSPESMRGAEAALCAGDQGKLSEYTDALFDSYHAYSEGEDIDVFSAEALTGLAAQLGLDEASFAGCLNSQSKKAEVEENMNMAEADDVGCLPTVVVGDFKIECRQPLETYIQAVEQALGAQTP
jgi:protein-disulfide isomerase